MIQYNNSETERKFCVLEHLWTGNSYHFLLCKTENLHVSNMFHVPLAMLTRGSLVQSLRRQNRNNSISNHVKNCRKYIIVGQQGQLPYKLFKILVIKIKLLSLYMIWLSKLDHSVKVHIHTYKHMPCPCSCKHQYICIYYIWCI